MKLVDCVGDSGPAGGMIGWPIGGTRRSRALAGTPRLRVSCFPGVPDDLLCSLWCPCFRDQLWMRVNSAFAGIGRRHSGRCLRLRSWLVHGCLVLHIWSRVLRRSPVTGFEWRGEGSMRHRPWRTWESSSRRETCPPAFCPVKELVSQVISSRCNPGIRTQGWIGKCITPPIGFSAFATTFSTVVRSETLPFTI